MQNDINVHAVLDIIDHSVVLKQQNMGMLAMYVEESKRVVVILSESGK